MYCITYKYCTWPLDWQVCHAKVPQKCHTLSARAESHVPSKKCNRTRVVKCQRKPLSQVLEYIVCQVHTILKYESTCHKLFIYIYIHDEYVCSTRSTPVPILSYCVLVFSGSTSIAYVIQTRTRDSEYHNSTNISVYDVCSCALAE